MRILDEVADAIQNSRNRSPQRVLISVKLEDQFDSPAAMAAQWRRMERHLGCDHAWNSIRGTGGYPMAS